MWLSTKTFRRHRIQSARDRPYSQFSIGNRQYLKPVATAPGADNKTSRRISFSGVYRCLVSMAGRDETTGVRLSEKDL
jgi:hypothetical protein